MAKFSQGPSLEEVLNDILDGLGTLCVDRSHSSKFVNLDLGTPPTFLCEERGVRMYSGPVIERYQDGWLIHSGLLCPLFIVYQFFLTLLLWPPCPPPRYFLSRTEFKGKVFMTHPTRPICKMLRP